MKYSYILISIDRTRGNACAWIGTRSQRWECLQHRVSSKIKVETLLRDGKNCKPEKYRGRHLFYVLSTTGKEKKTSGVTWDEEYGSYYTRGRHRTEKISEVLEIFAPVRLSLQTTEWCCVCLDESDHTFGNPDPMPSQPAGVTVSRRPSSSVVCTLKVVHSRLGL